MKTDQSITDFLNARIAEDEEVARAASERGAGGSWNPHHGYIYGSCVAGEMQDESQTQHVARYDPARVLAECTAKRAIVELYEALSASEYPESGFAWEAVKTALKSLAAVYAKHPEYRAEWRVGV